RTPQLLDARARRAGDAEDPDDTLVFDVQPRLVGAQVDLVQDDRLRPRLEAGAVGGQLAFDRSEALGRIVFGRVDHVQQQVRTLEVGEKLVPEPGSLARALDQARHVGNGELSFA